MAMPERGFFLRNFIKRINLRMAEPTEWKLCSVQFIHQSQIDATNNKYRESGSMV